MSRFRLTPSAQQERLLLAQCAQARFVWNLGLEQRLMWRPGRPASPGFVAQSRQLTEARAAETWLAAGSHTVQQQALRDLDQAWRHFFAGTHSRPTWRKAGVHEGFRIVGQQANRIEVVNRRWARALIPKVGWVKLRLSRHLPAAASYRVTRDRAGRWHLALATIPAPIQGPGTGAVVGVDRGVTVAAALSTGQLTSPMGLRPKEVERLLRLRRRLARAQRGSNRRAVVKIQIARLTAREKDRRRDWIEKTSTDLASRFDIIRVEDLDVRAMTRSARGTLDRPGRNVSAKAKLNRGILRSGWAQLIRRIEDKAPSRVERVHPAYTSQTCHACGHRSPSNRESQAVFRCAACGHQANADVNAARNIAQGVTAAGRAVAARGDTGAQARSEKREPQLAAS